jgi:hypothetical protein
MASSAAVHSPIPTIRKLGYALTEIVRLYMPTKVSLAPISLVRTTLTN